MNSQLATEVASVAKVFIIVASMQQFSNYMHGKPPSKFNALIAISIKDYNASIGKHTIPVVSYLPKSLLQ